MLFKMASEFIKPVKEDFQKAVEYMFEKFEEMEKEMKKQQEDMKKEMEKQLGDMKKEMEKQQKEIDDLKKKTIKCKMDSCQNEGADVCNQHM